MQGYKCYINCLLFVFGLTTRGIRGPSHKCWGCRDCISIPFPSSPFSCLGWHAVLCLFMLMVIIFQCISSWRISPSLLVGAWHLFLQWSNLRCPMLISSPKWTLSRTRRISKGKHVTYFLSLAFFLFLWTLILCTNLFIVLTVLSFLDPEPKALLSELNQRMAPQFAKLNKSLIELVSTSILIYLRRIVSKFVVDLQHKIDHRFWSVGFIFILYAHHCNSMI